MIDIFFGKRIHEDALMDKQRRKKGCFLFGLLKDLFPKAISDLPAGIHAGKMPSIPISSVFQSYESRILLMLTAKYVEERPEQSFLLSACAIGFWLHYTTKAR